MRGTHVRVSACALGLLLALHTSTAHADARSKARKFFEDGMRLIDSKRYGPGIESLIKANEALPHPDVQFNIARACLDAGLIPEAIQWFETYLNQPTPPPDDAEVREVVRSLRARLSPPQPAKPQKEETAPEETPSEENKPRATQPLPLPADASKDVKKLEQLADDMRPLTPERAKELTSIASRFKEALRLAQNEKRAPDKPELEPPKPEPPKPEPQASVRAQVKIAEQKLRAVEEYEEKEVVTAATRREARPQDAPAVVWVITQKEIRQRGYESVAEALRAVAGLHLIDDHVFIDVGVRGVHAGLRGESRIIKVLIDDHPVEFRPTSGNFLGPEMIPIRAVDRIELIRGPASALYGANAFLGVLQIITRKGGDIRGGSVSTRIGVATQTRDEAGNISPQTSVSADFVVGTKEGDLSVLMSGSIARMNRSGLSMPLSSPRYDEFKAAGRGLSDNDTATPGSLFGSLNYNLHRAGSLTLQAGLQSVDSRAEWLDYGALTHFTKVALMNWWARLTYDVQATSEAGIRAFTSYQQGGPTSQNRIRPLEAYSPNPDDNRHLIEDFGSQAVFSGLELRWDLRKYNLNVRVGTDVDVDYQSLTRTTAYFDQGEGANNQPGNIIPVASAQSPNQTFTDLGIYLQVSSSPLSFLDVVGGLRFDQQNVYGGALNGRIGSVARIGDLIFVKALYGSSFRAPAADQLYHGSSYIGDTTGCLDYAPCRAVGLRPQRAHTGEVVLGITPSEMLVAQVTGFISFVDDLIISFPTRTNSFVTTNAGTYLSKGLEFEAHLRPLNVTSALTFGSHAYFAVENTISNIPESLFQPADSIRPEYREASLFPSLTAGGGLDLAFLPAKLGLYLEGRFVGPRRASGSNLALSLGSNNYDGDDLPAYFELDANLSTRDLYLFLESETVLSLRVTDAIGAAHAEGGYRGWDIPAIGRMVFFRVIQEY